ncbi:MAG: TolC family protein [Ignavibacteriales bacterium]|nr:TolC family protein [Ignavibacteriales bacterium]
MSIKIRFLKFVFLFLIVSFQISSAQEKLKLTIEHAVEIGLQNSKTLHASSMKVKSSEAKVKEVFASRLPSIKLSASYRRLSEVDPFSITTPFGTFNISPSILDNYSSQVSIFQPLFTGFRLVGSNDAAEHTAKATAEDYNKDRSELVYNIKNSYWNLYKANEIKKVADENVDQIKAHLADARNLMNVGMLTQNDLLKLEVQLSDALYKQVDANNSVQLAMVALNNVMSISLDTEIEIASASTVSTKIFEDLNKLVASAYENRPEIKAADYRAKASEAGVTIAKSSWYPQISLFGNYYYSKPNQRILPTRNQFDGTWDAGVSLSMNIWDWLTTAHQTEQAEAALTQASDMLGALKDNVTLEVTQNYLNVNQAKQKIEISELAVKQAEENLRVTSEKFKSGLALTSDAIDAEVALLVAKWNHTNSVVDYELAKARLEKSIGQ